MNNISKIISPEMRLRIGLKKHQDLLAKENLSSQQRQDSETGLRNILQCLIAMRPGAVKRLEGRLGHAPTRNEIVLHFTDKYALKFAEKSEATHR